MPSQRLKSQILLDWFSVSYRSVFLGCALVLGVVGMGVYYFYFSALGPKAEAAGAISRAERKLARAAAYEGDALLDEVRSSARAALGEAHSAFGGARFDDARVAAIRSENLSQKAIELVQGGDGSAHAVRFYRLEGDVRIKRGGQFAWEPADRNMMLRLGDQVKTSSKASAQLIYFDGTITTVAPGSLLEIRALFEDPATQVRKVTEKLTWGEVTASTQRRNVEGSFHEVATASAAARSEEGGEFRVRYDLEERTATFDVFQGRIDVASAKSRESAQAGQRLRADPQGTILGKEELPSVPRLVAPTDQRVFVYQDPASETTSLTWQKVPGASRYHLLISNHFLFSNPLADTRRADTTVAIAQIVPGTYFWKVAAISSGGTEGPFSEVRSFRVSSERIRDSGDRTPPKLDLSEPVQTGPMLIINGKTEPGAMLWIDNEKIEVYEDGSFYAVIRLRKEGTNQLVFEAQDAAGNRTRMTRRAFVESY